MTPTPTHSVDVRRDGRWSVRVNGNWRATFAFTGPDVELLDDEDDR
ncbi:MAG: hypothetical protein QM621_02490 [Aeromicrobium sp.]